MRGQRLFVRPIEAGDAVAVREFLTANGDADAVPASGLVGKLLGRVVAVMAIDLAEPGEIRIRKLLVDRELRRKRIGRVMLSELEVLAAKMERDWLRVDAVAEARQFLERVGFVDSGNHMVRKVQR